ncbi:MAG: phospholipase C, phosphocholine-specific [Caulobacterales bacterium]|nr:phospholipase C, phosphocholine-specific [Caulobacterales bacterium]
MLDRRRFLAAAATGAAAAAGAAALPPAIARAAAIDADVRSGTIRDVAHVVILMQENRGFDHYFGAMAGVRGFADRFPIPLPDGRTVWTQENGPGAGRPPRIAPFPLNTRQTFEHMRVEGTPHNWTDAQAAWDQGRMSGWPVAKGEHAMGYYGPDDIPFQYALADAFTVCDAYHCAMQVGTNTNRLFLFTGTNDPLGTGGGPALSNSHDSLPEKGGPKSAYSWMTYPQRLQAAGISWRIYQDMKDNFSDNPLEGFAAFRAAYHAEPGADPALAANGLSTYGLDRLRADVVAGALPQVSYIVAPQHDCEHPGPSSPAQGADYTARVLAALTADPKVWARTVLLLMFDENDGFFDHVPPPAPPSRDQRGGWLGGSNVDLTGEHHLRPNPAEGAIDRPDLLGRPYGLGPRVPAYVISPWSRGGWVNSQVFDHTSVIRFLEARFGVKEPNISPWRRSVCGDLTSAFDFKTPNRQRLPALPPTAEAAARAAALPRTTRPPTPATPAAPVQVAGTRPSRALPYVLEAGLVADGGAGRLSLANAGAAGAVLHLYDLGDLGAVPRRYTLAAGSTLEDALPLAGGAYDLWLLGPNGFHRRFRGGPDAELEVAVGYYAAQGQLGLSLRNPGRRPAEVLIAAGAYAEVEPQRVFIGAGSPAIQFWPVGPSAGWYDLTLTLDGHPAWLRRLAGRVETGRPSVSDPAMHGPALMTREA